MQVRFSIQVFVHLEASSFNETVDVKVLNLAVSLYWTDQNTFIEDSLHYDDRFSICNETYMKVLYNFMTPNGICH